MSIQLNNKFKQVAICNLVVNAITVSVTIALGTKLIAHLCTESQDQRLQSIYDYEIETQQDIISLRSNSNILHQQILLALFCTFSSIAIVFFIIIVKHFIVLLKMDNKKF